MKIEGETELTEPPFESWFRDVAELVKNGGHYQKGLSALFFFLFIKTEYHHQNPSAAHCLLVGFVVDRFIVQYFRY